MPKCIYCEQEFIIKPTGQPGGRNRQLCYDCLPEGCDQEDIKSASKYYLRKKAAEEKIKRGCDKCGYNKSAWALEWHHPNDDKDYNPSILLGKGNLEGWILYQKEISKCQLLCCNCHREEHEKLQKTIFIKPKGSNKYEDFRQLVKNTYLEQKSITKTAQCLNKDPSAIRSILEYLQIPLFYKNGGAKIAMLDKKTEEIIMKFDSITEAALFLNVSSKGCHIGDVCNGRRKTAYGYKWKFI